MIVRIVVVMTVLFFALQLWRPKLKNPPAMADFEAPSDVKQILRGSCYACHSNETQLAWFDKIVPAYQLVARDVLSGRMVLNFSDLGALPKTHQSAVLYEAVSQIEMGAMPLPRYTYLHPRARVTPSQLAVLRNYVRLISPTKQAPQADVQAANGQYRQWITSGAQTLKVPPAANGIAFLPDYKNWKAISSTDRTDTNTLKMILGNDDAIRAIADNKIDPWPNGTVFAKVSWMRQADANGQIQTGKFEQVAFMIKDSGKYASTAGWGWAQWTGADLKPYGTDAGFARNCVACHTPLRRNDYVFTAPIVFLRASR